MDAVYDHSFNGNEFYILALFLFSTASLILCRKAFPATETILYVAIGIFYGVLFDLSIATEPVDFYDVNDSYKFELFDLLMFMAYGPYCYFFLFFLNRLKIKKPYTAVYILIWALLSMAAEYAGVRMGVYHYKNGYQIYDSFPIYLAVLTLQAALYRFLQFRKSIA